MLPSALRTTTVFAVAAVAVSKPSNVSAFKFATLVVDVTTNGAVPVAIFDISCGVVTLAVANTCAVPKLPVFALPLTLSDDNVPTLVIFG